MNILFTLQIFFTVGLPLVLIDYGEMNTMLRVIIILLSILIAYIPIVGDILSFIIWIIALYQCFAGYITGFPRVVLFITFIAFIIIFLYRLFKPKQAY